MDALADCFCEEGNRDLSNAFLAAHGRDRTDFVQYLPLASALFAFSRNVYGDNLPGLTLLILASLSLIVGFASWKYVEAPFRNKTKFSRASIFLLSALGTIFFIAAAIVAVKYEDSVMVKNPIVEAGQIDFDK
ncbi:MAG: hypothetical protein CM15mP120_10120 [Pseudomonadota bacterium]|nr:MAG: hypothetical protein CM15mP120_10120 [Pseudomonadota bacterium]